MVRLPLHSSASRNTARMRAKLGKVNYKVPLLAA
jgi:hypothetical protein